MKTHCRLTVGFTLTALASSHGWTLGLGDLTLNSYLNEPLSARVELLEAEALDEKDVHVGLASEAEFARLGVERDYYLTKIVFQIQSGVDGKTVRISTDTPLREPYLDLIIEARWPDGRLLREYTVLVDLPPQPSAPSTLASPTQPAISEQDDRVSLDDDFREYDRAVSDRPAPGGRYLVTNSDTLWRIASNAAAPGVSVEQTMLEIVAANPTAFQGGNINGLKSGYILQLPEQADIQLGLSEALAEVSLQNQEWAQGGSRTARGLTLVADENGISDVAAPVTGSDSAPLLESQAGLGEETATAEFTDTTAAPSRQEFDSLIATVSSLQASMEALEGQLAARDAELVGLRAELAARDAVPAMPEPVAAPVLVESGEVAVSSAPPALPVWPFVVGAATLMLGGATLIWVRRRQRASADLSLDGLSSVSSATAVEAAAVEDGRLSDPQILASKVVEEAEIYIAYGRTDQAVEVLSDALAQGLNFPSLNMCLLECYVESEQLAAAGALFGRIEQGGDRELLARARRLLFDAGLTSDASVPSPNLPNADPAVEEVAEDSVLGEFSFSMDPAFADEPNAKLETSESELMAHDTGPLQEEAASDASPSGIEGNGSGLDQVELAVSPENLTGGRGLSELAEEDDLIVQPAPVAPDISELSLTPIKPLIGDATGAEDPAESIYGAETDPRDSKLDLARAYLDMGDEEGARPVLMEVIKEGDLAQQAEARELLLRLEAS